MSTDIFGARVLGLDPDRREVRFRVFVVYYDTGFKRHIPLPERDPGFFLGLLWESGRWDAPIGEVVTVDDILDEEWPVVHARWFVEHVERTARRNDPPSADDWRHLHDFYYERDGRWRDEDRLVQADYTIRVTDARWMEHLSLGQAWGTTTYPLDADSPRREEAPHVPDLRASPTTLLPFGAQGGDPARLAFSDDGRYLAVAGDKGEVVVYETDDWAECARAATPHSSGETLMWVPGRHVVTLKDTYGFDDTPQWSYDVATGAEVDVPVEPGHTRSRSGRLRVEYGSGDYVDFVSQPFTPDRTVPVGADDETSISVDAVAFSADETRMFACNGPHVYVLEPETGRTLDTIAGVAGRLQSLAVSPDGSYLVTVGNVSEHDWTAVVCVRRAGDHEVITRRRLGSDVELAWSPDDRWLVASVTTEESGGEIRVMPIGLPDEPPEHLRAPRRTAEPSEERGPDGDSSLDPELIHDLAHGTEPLTAEELDALIRDHRRWLETGGGTGGHGSPWQVLIVAGLPLAVYSGPAGTNGAQASLRNRLLEGDVDLRGLVLPWADLTAIVGAKLDLSGADLRGCAITDAQIPHVCLRDAQLAQADFSRSDLRGADLTGADLTGTDLENADLTGADLTGACLDGAHLKGTKGLVR